MMPFKIHCIDVKNNLQNYIWLLEHTDSKQVVAVDPTEAGLVQEYCQQHGLELAQIWLTHWHKDHIGGVPELIQDKNIPVYGPREELSKIPFISHPLEHEDEFAFHGIEVSIISVPGHTLGHIVYFIDALDVLFCGDTLFAMGCGRVFEGTLNRCTTLYLVWLHYPHAPRCTVHMNIHFPMPSLHCMQNRIIWKFRSAMNRSNV